MAMNYSPYCYNRFFVTPALKHSTLLLSTLLLGCCTSSGINSRMQTAENIASYNALLSRQINTPEFTFTVFERITNKAAPTSIYIEGDGFAWLSRTRPSGNPTPKNPVGLRLAAQDKLSDNVIYIARPCQYSAITKYKPCSKEYWTSKRFAPEVIESFDQAIDKLKQHHQLSAIDLIGYSGGAAISVLLAEQRDDIRSLRTVAGNVDIDAFSNLHNISKMPKSLNPAIKANKIKDLPQIHFIGENDSVVPLPVFKSYKSKAGASQCIVHKVIPGVNHQDGWSAAWPQLINVPLPCQ